MNCVVTGAAGFIGSHLCERLLADGHAVTGIDCFTDYYPRSVKERNLAGLRGQPHFTFHELDLSLGVPADVVAGAEWVFHLAAMAGLTRAGSTSTLYARHNLTATHRLLEALKGSPTLQRLVYASTSSVYGKYASRRRVAADAAEFAVRHHEARRRAPVPGLRRRVRHAGGGAALLQRLRPAPAPGDGLSPLHRRDPARASRSS